MKRKSAKCFRLYAYGVHFNYVTPSCVPLRNFFVRKRPRFFQLAFQFVHCHSLAELSLITSQLTRLKTNKKKTQFRRHVAGCTALTAVDNSTQKYSFSIETARWYRIFPSQKRSSGKAAVRRRKWINYGQKHSKMLNIFLLNGNKTTEIKDKRKAVQIGHFNLDEETHRQRTWKNVSPFSRWRDPMSSFKEKCGKIPVFLFLFFIIIVAGNHFPIVDPIAFWMGCTT